MKKKKKKKKKKREFFCALFFAVGSYSLPFLFDTILCSSSITRVVDIACIFLCVLMRKKWRASTEQTTKATNRTGSSVRFRNIMTIWREKKEGESLMRFTKYGYFTVMVTEFLENSESGIG